MIKTKKRNNRGKKPRGHIRRPGLVYRQWLVVTGVVVLVLLGLWGVNALVKNWSTLVIQTEEAIAKVIEARVKTIMVMGVKHTPPEQLKEALGLEEGASLVGFDARVARANVEALDWVQTAYVVRVLPSTVRVNIEEYRPVARLEEEGEIWLVASDGHLITPAGESFSHLPIVRGEGARMHFGQLFDMLARVPDVKVNIENILFVGQRRWNLHLKKGGIVKLPEEDVLQALAYLVLLHKDRQIMDAAADIDLRLKDRVVLYLPENQGL